MPLNDSNNFILRQLKIKIKPCLSTNDWWRLAINQSLINSIFFRWRSVVWGLTLQFIFGLIILRWKVGRQVFQCLGDKMTTFLGFTENGSSFVYGFLIEEGVFMFKILSVIFFFSFMTRFVQKATFLLISFWSWILKTIWQFDYLLVYYQYVFLHGLYAVVDIQNWLGTPMDYWNYSMWIHECSC